MSGWRSISVGATTGEANKALRMQAATSPKSASLCRLNIMLFACVGVFMVVSGYYSFLIPAWEANDELDHVANIEYQVKQFGTFMPIAYERWHETHQPPLYYWVGAAWQRLLGLPAFKVSFPPWRATKPENDKLIFAHEKFDAVQVQQATALHKLRLLAAILGGITVALTFWICYSLTEDWRFSASATLVAALHPKFMMLSAAVTNDSLAILLGSALLLLCLRHISARSDRGRLLLAVGIGLTAGSGILTKLNLLPLIVFLIPATAFLSSSRWQRKGVDFVMIALSALLVCGCWLFHNRVRYGDWLAMQASTEWLTRQIPISMRAGSFFDLERSLNFIPQTLFRTFWYNGGFNQLVAPFAIYWLLWLIAGICFAQTFKAQLTNTCARLSLKNGLLVWLAAVAGLLAVLIIAHNSSQAEGRLAFPALPAFAVLLTSGCEAYFTDTKLRRLGLLLWPGIILLLDIYVFARFVLPHRQL